jgi:hypothetical protein
LKLNKSDGLVSGKTQAVQALRTGKRWLSDLFAQESLDKLPPERADFQVDKPGALDCKQKFSVF